MDAARFGVDVVLQRVGIGGFQFRDLPPVEDEGREAGGLRVGVVQGGDVFEDVGARGIGAGLALFAARHLHPVEEDFAQLLGRAHVEGFACDVLDFRLKPRHLLREGVGHAREGVAVHLHARHFHFGQHGHEGAFEGFVGGGDGRAVELGFEAGPEAVGDVGVFGRVFHGLGYGGAVEGDGLFAAAEERFDRDGQVAQIGFG